MPQTSQTAHASPPDQKDRGAAQSAFESLLAAIVAGTYPPGEKLPPERDLARELGASRPTLREALRRLGAWQLIEARRGSGLVVRPRREWSVEVLPAYLRHGGAPGEPKPIRVLADALVLRRSMVYEIISLVSERIPAGGTAAARSAARQAWARRHDGAAYAAADFEVTRGLVEAADFLPALWLLNRLSSVFEELSRSFSDFIAPPEDYLETHDRLFAAIEAGDPGAALAIARAHFEAHDRRLLASAESPG